MAERAARTGAGACALLAVTAGLALASPAGADEAPARAGAAETATAAESGGVREMAVARRDYGPTRLVLGPRRTLPPGPARPRQAARVFVTTPTARGHVRPHAFRVGYFLDFIGEFRAIRWTRWSRTLARGIASERSCDTTGCSPLTRGFRLTLSGPTRLRCVRPAGRTVLAFRFLTVRGTEGAARFRLLHRGRALRDCRPLR